MNRQAFADIEAISVRVEERRLSVKGAGNWRVHEFSGFDAIPTRLRPAFAFGERAERDALALDVKIRELYQRRKPEGRFEAPYETRCEDGSGKAAEVTRVVTISMRYRQPRLPVARAA